MHHVVTVLDDESYRMIQLLWGGIEEEFGIRPPFAVPMPHFTYHIAEAYDWDRLRAALAEAAQAQAPFSVHAGGIALFTGKKLVVHIPLVRNAALNDLQRVLWTELDGHAEGVVQHFHPELWIPHVTLAYHGLTRDILPHLVHWLAERSFAWDFHVDHVQVIRDLGQKQGLADRVDLVGPGARSALA